MNYKSYDQYLEDCIGEQWDDEEPITTDEQDGIITEREIEEIETRHLSPLQRFFWRNKMWKEDL